MWDECAIVTARDNARIRTEQVLIQSAIASMLTKNGHSAFSRALDQLDSQVVSVEPNGGVH